MIVPFYSSYGIRAQQKKQINKMTSLDFKPIQSLTLEDCYHIGQTAYLNEDYYHCVLWMRQLSEIEDYSTLTFSKFDVFDHFAFCLAKVGCG